MMSEGPGQSSAGQPPRPAPDLPATGDSAAPGPSGPAGPGPDSEPEPDYSLPLDPFRRGGAAPGDPDRPARSGPFGMAGPGGVGRRLTAAVAAVALASALIGGVVGGYVATRAAGGTTSPGYSLGPPPRAVPARSAGSVAGIAARVLPSVVMIRVDGAQGTGSGFVIRGGYIVTDNHVVTLDGTARSTRLQIVLSDGRTLPARLVGRDTYSDIAVIKPAAAVRLPALPLGNSAGLAVGDPVIAFGSPLGLAGTVTSGIVSALDRPVQPGAGNGPAAPQVFLDAIQTDAPINPGNSGGPLVNRQGRVIGVNAAFDTLGGSMITGQGGSIGLGFAIPVNEVARVATEIVRTGHATHAVLGAVLNLKYAGPGAQIATAPPRSGTAQRSLPVTPGGPAARAGLRAGDVIVSFAGQPVSSGQTLLDAVRAQPPGARVAVTYLARGQTRQAVVRLGSAGS
jgi:S1-C subfamily serine protease